jgi:hypothetical protein
VTVADDPDVDPAVLDGPAGELIRLGLIDPADVASDALTRPPADGVVEGPGDGSTATRETDR